MAETFNVSAMELKGKLTGVSVVSKRAKVVAMLVAGTILGFIFVATYSSWQQANDGPPAPEKKEEGGPKAVETADIGRLIEGVSDGQASAGAPPPEEIPDNAGTAPLTKSPPGLGTNVPRTSKQPALAVGPINSANSVSQADAAAQAAEADRVRQIKEHRYQLDDSAKRAALDVNWGDTRRSGSDNTADSSAGTPSNSPTAALDNLRKQLMSIAQGKAGASAEVLSSLSASQRAALLQSTAQQDDQNKQVRKEQFMRVAELSPDSGYLQQVKRAPIGQCELKAGMQIPMTLGCAANSDLPGQMCARVRENVYDHKTGQHIIIPQWTEAIGIYDAQVAIGQKRILTAWNRLTFSDDYTLNLQGMPGGDQAGRAGFDADVDNHYMRVAMTTGLSTLFSAGFQLSQSRNAVPNQAPTVGQTIANSIGQNVAQMGSAEAQKQLNIQPTLSRDQGYRFNIMVTKDIVFQCPKVASKVAAQ